MPARSKAQVVRSSDGRDGQMLKIESIPTPTLKSHEVLVKVLFAAQNPTDIQSLDSAAASEGGVLGCDFVGTVQEVGAEVTKFEKGDTLAGLIWGGEVEGRGAFSEYAVADEKIAFKVPKELPLEEAATVPLAATTAWLALFSKDCLAIPMQSNSDTAVLIWGGSSSVGQYAIQFAARYNFNVITTCSPKYFDTVQSLGASYAFDYRDENVISKIKAVGASVRYSFDTIGQKGSSGTASRVLVETTGRPGALCTVRPGKANTEDVVQGTKITDVLVWTAFLKDHRYGEFFWPASENDHNLCSELFENLPLWLQEGSLKTSTPKVLIGLDAVGQGFQEYRDGKISGYKIVYRL